MGLNDDNLVQISLIKLSKTFEKGCRGLGGAAARATSTYVLKEAVGTTGTAKIGSTSTGGDGLGPFYMPRR